MAKPVDAPLAIWHIRPIRGLLYNFPYARTHGFSHTRSQAAIRLPYRGGTPVKEE